MEQAADLAAALGGVGSNGKRALTATQGLWMQRASLAYQTQPILTRLPLSPMLLPERHTRVTLPGCAHTSLQLPSADEAREGVQYSAVRLPLLPHQHSGNHLFW